jgi:hypothetical protein
MLDALSSLADILSGLIALHLLWYIRYMFEKPIIKYIFLFLVALKAIGFVLGTFMFSSHIYSLYMISSVGLLAIAIANAIQTPLNQYSSAHTIWLVLIGVSAVSRSGSFGDVSFISTATFVAFLVNIGIYLYRTYKK